MDEKGEGWSMADSASQHHATAPALSIVELGHGFRDVRQTVENDRDGTKVEQRRFTGIASASRGHVVLTSTCRCAMRV